MVTVKSVKERYKNGGFMDLFVNKSEAQRRICLLERHRNNEKVIGFILIGNDDIIEWFDRVIRDDLDGKGKYVSIHTAKYYFINFQKVKTDKL